MSKVQKSKELTLNDEKKDREMYSGTPQSKPHSKPQSKPQSKETSPSSRLSKLSTLSFSSNRTSNLLLCNENVLGVKDRVRPMSRIIDIQPRRRLPRALRGTKANKANRPRIPVLYTRSLDSN